MKTQTSSWLLEGPAWVEYRTRLDLLGQAEDDAEVVQARQAMLADPQVQAVITGMQDWPGTVLNSHKSASQPFHRLNFLADLGLKQADPGMEPIIQKVMAHASSEGPFSLPVNISPSYGGDGQDHWGWALCDAPLLLYALVKFGLSDHPQVQRGISWLNGLVRENGWPCAVSEALGSWRGPGRKEDPCPFANLAMLKLLGTIPDLVYSPMARTGVETLLALWKNRRQEHPYIFYMGTDFSRLKAPLVWYDIIHVLDALSSFPWAAGDARLHDMLSVVLAKRDGENRYTPESVWQPWKEWEFGQKKVPSRWLTLIIERIGGKQPVAL